MVEKDNSDKASTRSLVYYLSSNGGRRLNIAGGSRYFVDTPFKEQFFKIVPEVKIIN